ERQAFIQTIVNGYASTDDSGKIPYEALDIGGCGQSEDRSAKSIAGQWEKGKGRRTTESLLPPCRRGAEMIKLETAHIEEVRGIRKLDIDFRKGTFAVSGPNGSGKSGVIDAIEFGLTGQISRLTGRGTKGLSVSEHGPHVDKTKFPDAAFVELRIFLPALNKSATITRKVPAPKKPKFADDDVKAIRAEVADHPEITLSRREILRFILVEPTKRSEEIQTLLKLDEIGHTRATLNTAQNKLQAAHA